MNYIIWLWGHAMRVLRRQQRAMEHSIKQQTSTMTICILWLSYWNPQYCILWLLVGRLISDSWCANVFGRTVTALIVGLGPVEPFIASHTLIETGWQWHWILLIAFEHWKQGKEKNMRWKLVLQSGMSSLMWCDRHKYCTWIPCFYTTKIFKKWNM